MRHYILQFSLGAVKGELTVPSSNDINPLHFHSNLFNCVSGPIRSTGTTWFASRRMRTDTSVRLKDK
jgi:hypothetical protein